MSATLQGTLTEDARVDVAARRVAASNAAAEQFFSEHADSIARACQAMAARFQVGARLLVLGDPAQRSDVAHVVVEFLHPVVVGKRALPAIAVDEGSLTTLGRDADILLVLDGAAAKEAAVMRGRELGMLTLWLSGNEQPKTHSPQPYRFAVPSTDPCIVQETHEMLYHVLWELVHVFLDHRGPSA